MNRALSWLAHHGWNHPWRVLSILLLPTLVLGFFASQLRLDGSLLGAVNDNDPQVVRLKQLKKQFPAGGTMALLVEGGTEAQRRAGVRQAAEQLVEQPSVLQAAYRLDAFIAYGHGILLIKDETFERLKRRLEGLAFVLEVAQHPEAQETLSTPQESSPAKAEEMVDLAEMIAGDLPSGLVAEGLSDLPLRSGWFASPDGRIYVLDLRTTLDPIADDVGGAAFVPIDQALASVRQAYPDLTFTFAGMAATAHEDQANVLSQLLPLSSISLLLVLFLLSRLNRSIWSVGLTGCALAVALVWTFGLVHLVIGYASVMAAGFAILLFGLGIDHAAHLLLRFDRERRAGCDGAEATRRMLVQTGRGVLVGGLTTALAFGLMAFIDFKAAVHLGITACMGMVATLITVMTVLPAGLRLTVAKRQVPPEAAPVAVLEKITQASLASPKWVMGLSAFMLLLGLAAFPRFELETDLEAVMTQDLPSMIALRRLKDQAGITTEAVLSAAPDLATARARAERLEALPQVARVEGVHRLLPPNLKERVARNQAMLPIVEAFEDLRIEGVTSAQFRQVTAALEQRIEAWPETGEWRAVKARARGVLERIRAQDPKALQAHLVAAQKALKQGLTDPVLQPEDLPEPWRSRYLGDGEYLSLIFPKDERLAADSLSEFRAAVTAVDPQAAGGLFVVDYLLVGGVERMKGSLGLILLVLFVVLFLDLRRPKQVAVALVPLLCGSIIGLGALLWLGRPITLVMLSAFPLIFGIGIDDGVHLLHGWREGGDISRSVSQIGAGILFTSLSTALSFGVLLGLDHNGFEGLALLVIIGVGTCFVASMTLLPVLASRFLEPPT